MPLPDILISTNIKAEDVHDLCCDVSRFQLVNGVLLSFLFLQAIITGTFWWYFVAVSATIFLLGLKGAYQQVKISKLYAESIEKELP